MVKFNLTCYTLVKWINRSVKICLFFSLYNNIKKPSELKQGSDYCLFKKGVKPMWEDPFNKHGGRWLISLEKKQRNSDLDKYWLEIVSSIVQY